MYGKMLNEGFNQHELEKDEGRTDSTWEEWIKDNVGISSPQGRKIRAVANLLVPYPGFMRLGLSFSEVYSRRKQIAVMLAAPNQHGAITGSRSKRVTRSRSNAHQQSFNKKLR